MSQHITPWTFRRRLLDRLPKLFPGKHTRYPLLDDEEWQ